MARPLHLDEDRLFPVEPETRSIARRLYGEVRGLPIIGPHGHTDPEWFAGNAPIAAYKLDREPARPASAIL